MGIMSLRNLSVPFVLAGWAATATAAAARRIAGRRGASMAGASTCNSPAGRYRLSAHVGNSTATPLRDYFPTRRAANRAANSLLRATRNGTLFAPHCLLFVDKWLPQCGEWHTVAMRFASCRNTR